MQALTFLVAVIWQATSALLGFEDQENLNSLHAELTCTSGYKMSDQHFLNRLC